jgi:signal transduction histidine kinase
MSAMAGRRSVPTSWVVLVALGAGSTAALAVLVVRTREAGALLPIGLAFAWLVAGSLSPRHSAGGRSMRLVQAVGALHLSAFALTGWAAEAPPNTASWAAAVAGDAAYGAGFVALGLLLALYPTGRSGRWVDRAFTWLALGAGVFAALAVALLRDTAPLALGEGEVPAPAWLPGATLPFDPAGLLPVLAVIGVILLVTRRAASEDRVRLGWAKIAGLALAFLLAATPAGTRLLGETLWSGLFVTVVGAIPFVLVAGVLGVGLGRVDRYVVRTFARGLVVLALLALIAYAVLASPGGVGRLALVVVVLVAVATGLPATRTLERFGDQWLTGGRVRRSHVLGDLVASLEVADRAAVARTCTATVVVGFGCGWSRLRTTDGAVEEVGQPGPQVGHAATLRSGDATLGTLECGPRRGGWGRDEVAALDGLLSHAAVYLREAWLTAELAGRLDELVASRARLVRAEDAVRRQVERDLHDGVQQQLVALLAQLEAARVQLAVDAPAHGPVTVAQELAREALHDLRALVGGIHPPLLSDRGLLAAVEARAALLPITVAVDADPRMDGRRFAPEVEGAAYFVVSESLANVLKHSGASRARVVVAPLGESGLRVAVTDEGSGTASYDGSGLTGLRDRVDALGGRFEVVSTPGVGTTVVAELGVTSAVVTHG